MKIDQSCGLAIEHFNIPVKSVVSAEKSDDREKVIGYDMAPQPVQTSTPNLNEE